MPTAPARASSPIAGPAGSRHHLHGERRQSSIRLDAVCAADPASMGMDQTGDAFGRQYVTVNYGIMYTAKGVASLLVPLGNVLTHATGNWHAVYAVGCGMNVVAALLGLFVLKPVIKARLAPPTQPATSEPAYADEDIGRRRAVG